MDYQTMSDMAILGEIGRRIRRERLNRNLTQAQLAEEAGIGRRTLQKAEEGNVTTVETLVALLRGLGLLSQLDCLLPEPSHSPVQLARRKGRKRERATGKRQKKGTRTDWDWGES